MDDVKRSKILFSQHMKVKEKLPVVGAEDGIFPYNFFCTFFFYTILKN